MLVFEHGMLRVHEVSRNIRCLKCKQTISIGDYASAYGNDYVCMSCDNRHIERYPYGHWTHKLKICHEEWKKHVRKKRLKQIRESHGKDISTD